VQAALVGQGFEQVMDDRRMKLEAQTGIVYLLSDSGRRETGIMVEAIQGLDGVEKVMVFPEQREAGSR
jgi:hypothetical protein